MSNVGFSFNWRVKHSELDDAAKSGVRRVVDERNSKQAQAFEGKYESDEEPGYTRGMDEGFSKFTIVVWSPKRPGV